MLVADKIPNPYDTEFKWNEEDPFLGTKPEFGYVPILEQEGNEAFYWLWPCLENKNAPVLVTMAGGPGCPAMYKIFNGNSPLSIDEEAKEFVKNEDALSNKCHMLYIENPVGSGYSVAKTSIENFKMNCESMEELFAHLLSKYPEWKDSDWYWNGESFCGFSIPSNAWNLSEKYKLKLKGVILECPVMDNQLNFQPEYYSRLLKKYKVWDGCVHKCCCMP